MRLHAAIVARSRAPVFFTALGVPDTLDGRLDLIFLHAWLVLDRVKEQPEVAQTLTDLLFIGFDEGLRELGAGDIGIGHRMKKIGNAYYGRMQAYDQAADATALADAVERNVYRGVEGRREQAIKLARYAFAAKQILAARDPLEDALDFGPLP
ncbi:MAG TPA: ubiquinol-cytochrome C chaperone family protein [Rhizomicrobium sp.]|nr:ubiquinol-cytochrome C chaperone family protein [Rhizomicrobium sp.]